MKTLKSETILPRLGGRLFIADGGLETTLVFHEKIDLPLFASFPLVRDPARRRVLKRYYCGYADVAERNGLGLILETPTWRANPDWAAKLDLTPQELAAVNREALALMAEIREEYWDRLAAVVVSGCVGPRGDGYVASATMTADEAEAYHREQIAVFVHGGSDMISAMTLNTSAEAIGIVRAAAGLGAPVIISFTVETDGRLPSGQTLGDAIREVDAVTGAAARFFMVNCAHPTHFAETLRTNEAWVRRIGGIRPNASRCSHAELDEAEVLDEGNPVELGREVAELRALLPGLAVVGGCCGTDHRHVSAICQALTARREGTVPAAG